MSTAQRFTLDGWSPGPGRAITQSTVRSFGVVMFLLLLDQYLRPTQAAKDLPVEKFISEPTTEALAISVPQGDSVSNRTGGKLSPAFAVPVQTIESSYTDLVGQEIRSPFIA